MLDVEFDDGLVLRGGAVAADRGARVGRTQVPAPQTIGCVSSASSAGNGAALHGNGACRIPYRVPADHDLPSRLPHVLAVIYLIYNASLTRSGGPPLCSEAIRLARILVTLMPDEPEVSGLLALLLLTESRRASRTRPDGSLAVLAEQNRELWDRVLIEEGQAIIRACLRRDQPGPYQLQAAINAVHADAGTFEETDWRQIVALYDQLLALAPTPVVTLNRAIAISEIEGPARGARARGRARARELPAVPRRPRGFA